MNADPHSGSGLQDLKCCGLDSWHCFDHCISLQHFDKSLYRIFGFRFNQKNYQCYFPFNEIYKKMGYLVYVCVHDILPNICIVLQAFHNINQITFLVLLLS